MNFNKFNTLCESVLTEGNAKDELIKHISVLPNIDNGAPQAIVDMITNFETDENGKSYKTYAKDNPMYGKLKEKAIDKIISDIAKESMRGRLDDWGIPIYDRKALPADWKFSIQVREPSKSKLYTPVRMTPKITKAIVQYVSSVAPNSQWLAKYHELKGSSKGVKQTADPRAKLKDVKELPEYKKIIAAAKYGKRNYGVTPITSYVDGTSEGGQKLTKHWNAWQKDAIDKLRLGEIDKVNAMLDKVRPSRNLGGGGPLEYSSITWYLYNTYN